MNEIFLSIEIKTTERKYDFFAKFLIDKCDDHITLFLVNLRSKLVHDSQIDKLLSKDEQYIRAITEMDKSIKADR